MPIYEYRCQECSKTFEVLQKFSDSDLTACRYCSGEVQRLLSPPAIIFKGSGWYVTDYAKTDKKQKEKAEKGAPACAAACDKKCE